VLAPDRRADVARVDLPGRQYNLVGCRVLVRDDLQEVVDAVQSGALLVVRFHHPPGRFSRVGGREHRVLALEYSTHFDRAVTSIGEIFQRFVGWVIRSWKRRSCSTSLTENQYLMRMIPERNEHSLELGRGLEEVRVFLVRAEAHDVLDAGPVVPAAVEEHPFAGGWELGHVALEVPLRRLTFGRYAERADAADARVQGSVMRLITPPLPAASRPSNRPHDLQTAGFDPFLELDQFDLEPGQLGLVVLGLELLATLLDSISGGRVERVTWAISAPCRLSGLERTTRFSDARRNGFHERGRVFLGDGRRRGGSSGLLVAARPSAGCLRLGPGDGVSGRVILGTLTVWCAFANVGLLGVHVMT